MIDDSQVHKAFAALTRCLVDSGAITAYQAGRLRCWPNPGRDWMSDPRFWSIHEHICAIFDDLLGQAQRSEDVLAG